MFLMLYIVVFVCVCAYLKSLSLFVFLMFLTQVYAEFRRINQIDLKSTFLTSLDNNTRSLLKLFRAKVRQPGMDDLESLLDNLDGQVDHRFCLNR